MYKIIPTKRYIKSLHKIRKSGTFNEKDLMFLKSILASLQNDEKLDAKYKDHYLVGNKYGQRECHIKYDLLLVYKKEEKEQNLVLIDIGSHNHIF